VPYTNLVAISPGIPTSFVPRQSTPSPTRPQRAGRDYFFMGALVLAGLAVVLAAGTFLYERYLTHSLETKTAELSQATANVNEDTVRDFVQLRDRLANGKMLLTNHVMLSQFFDDLEHLTLQNVRYNSLSVTVAGDRTAKIVLSGTAKNFNTLAAQSTVLAGDKRIKRAIFSNITITNTNLVGFKLTADLDTSLVAAGETPSATQAATPIVPVIPAPTATTTTQTVGAALFRATTTAATTTP